MTTFDTNGRRNEHDIFVRGFGRWQVPLSIDGVRVYLPADNRLDFSRFLTADLAEVQIEKGYVSVLNGPGGLGGAINLVTRKPTRPFEARFQSGAALGGDADYEGWNGYASAGTRQERFYAQASVSYLDRDEWRVSDDFTPTSMEDGGTRNGSGNRDSRINLKAGFLPNDTDEYTINYTRQEGEKGAPLNVNNNPPVPPNSFWTWPWWNIENLYWLSNTRIGEQSYVKTQLFYNKFENALYAWDDGTYSTQSANGRFQSIYDDDGYGGSIEAGFGLLPRSTTRASIHYRRDKHTEFNINRPTHPTLSQTEPVQENREDTYSFAVENTFHASDTVDLLVGASYDKNKILLAQEWNAMQGLFENPTGGSDSTSAQASLQWHYTGASSLSASLSSRTRFPTIFERFSTRFGTALPNPDLESERSTNYEITWQSRIAADTKVSAALFFAHVTDMMQTVVVATTPTQLTQSQNVGNGENYGIELSGDTILGERLTVGGNYTYLHRTIKDALLPTLQAVGTPTHQGFLFATWVPIQNLSLTPNVEFASDRWSDVTGGTYRRTGEYTLLNLQAQYAATENVVVALGGRNLLDEDFQLADGFPEAGRTLFAKLQITF
jgi:iron complex outermembrane recepter protein